MTHRLAVLSAGLPAIAGNSSGTGRVAGGLRRGRAALAALGFALMAALLAAGCGRNRAVTAGVPATPAPGASPSAPPSAPAAPAAAPAPSGPLPSPSLTQPFEPGTYVEQGTASWYGDPFNGRRASSGEVFDMTQPVAAHRTLPFGSMVRVTNLTNGLSTVVRIIDRGPFVEGRIIDLSQAAARSINMLGPGTAMVRLDLLSTPAPLTGTFTVQVGAFSQRANADRIRAQFGSQYPVSVQEVSVANGRLYRVRVGRESTQAAAAQLAAKLTQQGFQAFVVRVDGLN